MTASLLGIAFAATLAHPQVLPLTSAPSLQAQDVAARHAAAMNVQDRAQDVAAMLRGPQRAPHDEGLAPLQSIPRCPISSNTRPNMVTRSYFDHNTPEGLSPFALMDKANYRYGYAGENLASIPIAARRNSHFGSRANIAKIFSARTM